MRSAAEQAAIRSDVFRWLDGTLASGQSELSREELENYHYGLERLPLLDTARGIRNPQDFDSTLTIMTSTKSPYGDETISSDGFVRYAYQSRDGGDNSKLRRAFENAEPLVYFRGIRPKAFVPYYPVYVVADDTVAREFLIAVDESMRFFGDPLHMTLNERRYAERTVRTRLHQPVFRAQIMYAYRTTCAICSLKHGDLLDAAHIIADSDVYGFARVSNGLALCKIHHAAYDRNLLGITPDYEVRIDRELLDEIDGPMLRHGLQDMHGRRLNTPTRLVDSPSKDSLAVRFAEFSR
ncbi:restriction endonuclease [Lacisediminihabitans profunda]|uniref:Restriction endonuclease n=2 Tax=Lacisediminihabitans profunda TaxID=2594790 RepID=A0A5C8UU42_9MICO|nr:restriction endonuclease [Lacisediminihabitans profunda]